MRRRRSPLGHTAQAGRAPLRMLDGQRYGDRRKQHAYARNLNRQKFACPHRSLTSGSLSHRNHFHCRRRRPYQARLRWSGSLKHRRKALPSCMLFYGASKAWSKTKTALLPRQVIIQDAYGIPDTGYLEPTNSKAVGGYAANGFALSPIRAVFSDSIGRVVVTSSEAVRLSSPSSTSCRRGGRQSDRQTIAPASRLSSGFSLLATSPRL